MMRPATSRAQEGQAAPQAKTTTTTQKPSTNRPAPKAPPGAPEGVPDLPPVPEIAQGPTGTSEPSSLPIDPQMIAAKVESVALGFFFTMGFVIVGLPIARAWARRMDRRGAVADSRAIPADLTDRLTRIEQAVEAISIEVERVSEGQRFTTKLLSERAADPAALPGREHR